MKRILLLVALSFAVVTLTPSLALAAKPDGAGKPKPPSDGGGETTSELVGYDISYPQCGRRLPTDHYFGIVGVNGGRSTEPNECLVEQLQWAKTAKTHPKQDQVQLYVNTANPAQESIYNWKTWPTENTTENPYTAEPCTGDNTLACSWQYGWNRAKATHLEFFLPAAGEAGVDTNSKNYTWWLDVETMNSWQSGSQDALERNVATLEGMAEYFAINGKSVGLYSTGVQWNEITGGHIKEGSNLLGLANWRPSGASLNNAIVNCDATPLTKGGYVALTQYIRKNLDHNHSCA